MSELMKLVISTDGACSGNPGPGGWAAVLRFGDKSKEIAGYEAKTTNGRMEAMALIKAVGLLKLPCDIAVRTDSRYVCTAIANSPEWKEKGWRTKTGARCKNFDLWQQLDEYKSKMGHKIHYEWIHGHSGDPDNERCDELAKQQIELHRG